MRDSEEAPQDLDAGIDEALEGSPRATRLLELTNALRLRRQRLEADLGTLEDPTDALRVSQQLDEIDEQIQVLAEEASISQFVEETVRFSHEVRRLHEG